MTTSRDRFNEAIKHLDFTGDIEVLYPLWLKCEEQFMQQIKNLNLEIENLRAYIDDGYTFNE